MRDALLATLALALVSPAGFAADIPSAENHDYAVAALPRSTSAIYSSALIVDRRTGDIWEYIDEDQSGNTPSGVLVIYEGRVVPGTEPGQIVARHGFGAPTVPPKP